MGVGHDIAIVGDKEAGAQGARLNVLVRHHVLALLAKKSAEEVAQRAILGQVRQAMAGRHDG
jgi:hypothetical protein